MTWRKLDSDCSDKILAMIVSGYLLGWMVRALRFREVCVAKTLHIRRINDLEAHPRHLFDVKILG